MAIEIERVKRAKDAGASDEQILNSISRNDESLSVPISKGREANVSDSDILERIIANQGQEAPVQPEEESLAGSVIRNIARLGVEGTASVAGLPGDLIQGIKSISESLPKGPDFLQRERTFLAKGIGERLGQIPGKEELKKPSKAIAKVLGFEGFFDPKSELESFADNVVSDATLLAVPVKGKIPFIRSITTALGSNVFGEAVKRKTGSEAAGELTKASTMFMGGLLRRESASKFVEKMFGKVDKVVEDGVRIQAFPYAKELKDYRKTITTGGTIEQDKKILDFIDPLIKQAEEGTIEAGEVLKATRKAHRLKGIDRTGKGQIAEFNDISRKHLGQLDVIDPSFSKNLKDSNEAFAALRQGERTSERMRSFVGKSKISDTAKGLLAFVFPKAAATAVVGAVASGPALKAKAILTTPAFRPHLTNLISAAAKDNAPGMTKALVKFDKAVKKAEKEGNLPEL